MTSAVLTALVADPPPASSSAESVVPLAELERRAVVGALAAFGGNRHAAAKALGIGERTLYRKIAEYGLP